MSLLLESPAPAVLVVVMAIALAALLVRDGASPQGHRFAAIDGLRGFLSPFVFLHHSAFWFAYSHHFGWTGPPSRLYSNFGGLSVALFFMITSFLFCSKLIESRTSSVDWLRLYVSRVLRLTPLYWCAVSVVLVIAAVETGFQRAVPTPDLWTQVLRWFLFTIGGPLDVNRYPDTHLIIAGVTWTLPYEWYFYLLLPLIALAMGIRSAGQSPIWLIGSVLAVYSFSSWGLSIDAMYPFIGGAVAAAVAHVPRLREQLTVRGAHILTLVCIWLAYAVLPPGAGLASTLLLSISFTFVACGVDVFGLLTWEPIRRLSSLTYGIYLWHGIVLFVVMRYVVGSERAATLSLRQHWLVVLASVPLVVGVAAVTFRFIERPAMDAVPAVTRWLRRIAPAPATSEGDRARSS